MQTSSSKRSTVPPPKCDPVRRVALAQRDCSVAGSVLSPGVAAHPYTKTPDKTPDARTVRKLWKRIHFHDFILPTIYWERTLEKKRKTKPDSKLTFTTTHHAARQKGKEFSWRENKSYCKCICVKEAKVYKIKQTLFKKSKTICHISSLTIRNSLFWVSICFSSWS